MSTFMVQYGQIGDPTILPEEIFVEDPPEDIDLSSDTNLLAQMDQSLRELSDVAMDMQEAGGMSQRLATEAERILPGVLGRPIGYYTQAPSATHYRVSLEEVQKGIWALVAAAAAAVLVAIYKIYKWLTGGSDEKGSSGGAAKSTEKLKAEAEHVQEKGPEMAQGMLEASHTLRSNPIEYKDRNGKTVHYNNMEKIIETLFLSDPKYKEEKNSLIQPDGVTYDIIYDGPYAKTIQAVANAKIFDEVRTRVHDKLKVIETAIHEDRNANGNQVLGLAAKLQLAEKPIEFKFNGKMQTLRELTQTIRTARDAAANKRAPSRLHYDDVFHKVEQTFKRKEMTTLLEQGIDFLPTVQEMEEKIRQLEGFVGDLSQDDQPGGNSAEVAQRIRAILGDLGQQITGFAGVMNEVKHYVHDVKRITTMCAGFAKEIVQKISLNMGDENTMDIGWKKVKAQIQGAIKAMQEAHYPSGYHEPGA